MPLVVVFLHRDRMYADTIGARWRVVGGNSLVLRHAQSVVEAVMLLAHGNRLLFDADDDFVDVLEHAQHVRCYALTSQLDASLSSKLCKHGVIAVGNCTTERDIDALAETIISGMTAVPLANHVLEYLATPGRFERERSEEEERMIDTALQLTGNNVSETARLLGIPRTTVQSRLKKKRGDPD